jgi:hypothetical protein
LRGKTSLKSQGITKNTYFFLDECLPHGIGDFLHSMYPITSWFLEFNGQQGYKDTPLIQYMGAKGYTWITKDDAAKSEHENEIRTAGISVVWIRGLEREKGKPKKNKVSTKDVHRMLTDKLDELYLTISTSKVALYFLLCFKTGHNDELIPVIHPITLESFFKDHLPKLS